MGIEPTSSAWKAEVLPLNYTRADGALCRLHPASGPSPASGGGGGRIRTFEGVSRQIYSLLPLAAWVPLHVDARAGADPRRRAAELAKGLEPPTTSLQMRCSTN